MAGSRGHRRWRGLAWLAAAGTLLVAGQIAWFGQSIGSVSPLLWGTAGMLVVVALVSMRLACLSAERLDRWQQSLGGAVARIRGSTEGPELFQAGQSLLLMGCLAAGFQLTSFLRTPDDPADDDQAAYLNTAAEIHASGGLRPFLSSLYRGDFAEANRHPLYLALLSIHPTETFGRGISCVCGVWAAILAVLWTRRHAGSLAAGIFLVLLSANATWLFSSSRVFSESLLMLVSFVAWRLAGSLTSQCPSDFTGAAAAGERSIGRSLAAGGTLGLAYLTKGTGLLLLVGTIGAMILAAARTLSFRRCRTLLGPTVGRGLLRVVLLVAAFLLVASPLVERNRQRFGSLFYNVNSQLLFEDEYTDPYRLAAERSTAEAARLYWESHSLPQLIGREVQGAVWEAYLLLRSLGPAPLDDARILFGGPLFLLALLGLAVTPAYPARLTLIWTGLLWLVFAWYVPIAAGERFLAPVLLPLLVGASAGAARLVQSWTISPRRAAAWVKGVGTTWAVAWALATALYR